jgi:hypothetical protein
MIDERRMLLLRLILEYPNKPDADEKYRAEYDRLKAAGVVEQELFLEKIPYPSSEEFERKYGIVMPKKKKEQP